MNALRIKSIPKSLINQVRSEPEKSGLQFRKFGKSYEIKDYSDSEIAEMIVGIYKEHKMLLTDNQYFIDLKEVKGFICVLKKVSYVKAQTEENIKEKLHNSIKNIRTFYIQDYFAITDKLIEGNKRHKITEYFYKVGAINKGRNENNNLFTTANDYQTLQVFEQGDYPKDLFHPIKQKINDLYFNDDYAISDFKVECDFVISNN
ncbi:MAG: hypothetical protein JNL70_02690 [Saprospiraceae bacterium]|nr:hypothetical protein [Saprospiraceae bacterium]